MNEALINIVEDCPVIAAVKDENGLAKCLETDISVVFVLFGDICSIGRIVDRIKDCGKRALVHIDLITGLSSKEIAVDYIHTYTRADGIISTKPALIKRGKELGLYTVQRYFVIDSLAIDNILKQTDTGSTDLIEILPGVMPKVIRQICSMIPVPVIAGGLVSDKEDVLAALNAGAVSVSTTRTEVWRL